MPKYRIPEMHEDRARRRQEWLFLQGAPIFAVVASFPSVVALPGILPCVRGNDVDRDSAWNQISLG